MDKSTILAVIGTIATVGFGGWGIYLALKRRYPGRITFLKENSIGLFDTIVRNLPELAVLYEGKPVSQNLVLLKGSFLNTGSKDITESMVEERLTITIPEGYKWLTGKIISSSSNVRAQVQIPDDHRLVFDVGLFRCDEYVRFQVLAEVPLPTEEPTEYNASKLLENTLSFSHRIADTQKIEIKTATKLGEPARVLKVALVSYLFFFLLLAGGFWFWKQENVKLNYLMKINDNKTIEVKVDPQADGKLKLKGVNDSYDEIVPAAEFFSKRQWEPKIVSEPITKYLLLALAFVILDIVLDSYIYIRAKRSKRLRNLIELS
jgi:hypothetical protein